jgi:hypothetical protein
MKKRVLLGAAAIAFLSALGHFGAKPLLAQIRAAFVKNIDEPGRSPYQVRASGGTSTHFCQVVFPPVPAGKRLVIDTLNVLADIPVATNRGLGQFSPDGAVVLDFSFSSAGASYWVANLNARAYAESGSTPVITVLVDLGKSCTLPNATLTGYLVDLNQ